jgi:hypothetical protein
VDIVGDQGLWNIACHGDDRIHMQLLRSEGQQDRHGVILARIGIDDQCSFRHNYSLRRSLDAFESVDSATMGHKIELAVATDAKA